ncbi:MAG: AraC family transcriptional regulator [Oscillospiraceae bacterium]|jgi:AraC family transcriptional regulator|nr:AraC family transcriptional regulator [Oscillospiraceae bacterium]
MANENPIFRSLAMIENRISEKLTVDNIADSVYFSKYHYSRLFREIAGDSVMEYVTKRKLTLAGGALLETDSSILDIALQFGYDSHEGFTRSFKAYMGVSPTEYRKYGLAAISQKSIKERITMLYSKTTDEIIRELNGFIANAKELSERARKIDLPYYAQFWASVADNTDAFAERIKEVLDRITSIAARPDEITNRFTILKVIEDVAFETNVMALHVGLNAVGRALPEHIEMNKPLCDKYAELAQSASIKAGKAAQFLNELTALIIDDMRKTTGEKIKDAVQKGKAAAESIQGYAVYIKDELTYIVNELDKTPIESVTVTMLDDYLSKLKIISLATKVDALRWPDSKPMFEGIGVFTDSLGEAADFCQTIIWPESNPPMERSKGKHFLDIAYQGNILRFYTKGEVEKMAGPFESGGLLNDEQKTAFKKIDGKIDGYIKLTLGATDESAYKEIADRVYEVAADMNAESAKLEDKGGAIKMLADEFKHLGDSIMRRVN